MGVPSSAGPDLGRTPHRPLRSTFMVMVAAPAACLTVLWLAATSLALGGVLGGHRLSSLSHLQVIEIALVAAAGALVVLVTLVLAGFFARRVARDLAGLTVAARKLAAGQPVQAAEDEPQPDAATGTGYRRGTRTTEIAQATGAIADLQETAAAAAASEAGMRDGLRQVIVSLARRNQSLLQRQLRLIDALEQKAADPGALADLFALDHLTTRMRRHAESLAILADAAPGRSWREPVPVIDVIRGAMAEVEDYQRVAVLTQAEDAISGSAAADMIHLLAELIENATLFSPSGTAVEVRAGRVANGFAIEVDDRGLGIEPDQLTEINRQLDRPPDFDLANSDRLGLFVGGKLAARYGVRVSLRPSPYGGTTAIVLLPTNIVVPVGGAGVTLQPATEHPALTSGLPGERSEPLALVGPRPVPSAPSTAAPSVVTVPASSSSPLSPVQAVPPVHPVPPTPLTTPRRSADPAAPAARAMPLGKPVGLGKPVLPGRTLPLTPPAARSASPPDPAGWPASATPAAPATRGASASPTAPDTPAAPAARAAQPGSSGIPGLPSRRAATAAGPASPASGSAASGVPAGDLSSPAAAPSIASVWSVPPGRSVFSPAETPPARPAGPAPDGPPAAPASSALPPVMGAPAAAPSTTGQVVTPGAGAGSTASSTGTPLAGTPLPGRPGSGGQGGLPASGTYRGLPRRTRQASLSPHLRDSPSAGRPGGSDPLPAPVEERAPEEARNLAASLQSGWQRGRAADLPDTTGPTAAGSDQAGRDPASGKEK
jgi:signal transduction histidine kinase